MSLDTSHSRTLGADIRALRKSRKVSLGDLAAAAGRSVGWMSQVERDISAPSMSDLESFSKTLGVPLSLFFGHTQSSGPEAGFVVRAGARRHIGSHDGLTESLLSPDLTDDFEVLHCVFAPGARREAVISRPTQEVATLVSGTLKVWINDEEFDLATGDSFRVRGDTYRWHNSGTEPAVAIWVIAPPVY